jgi:hypothetical protein
MLLSSSRTFFIQSIQGIAEALKETTNVLKYINIHFYNIYNFGKIT